MALISNAKGRRENDTPSGYERLFGNKKLGQLFSKAHATVISSGNELEKFLAVRIEVTDGISIDMINKEKRVFKNLKKDSSGKLHKIDVDCLVEKENKIYLIELKDGDTFDTKKVAGEMESLKLVKKYFTDKGKNPDDIIVKFCSFNAANHAQIERGAKGLLPEGYAMTGGELCELLKLDYEKIREERKKHGEENLKYFINELKEIPRVSEVLGNYQSS